MGVISGQGTKIPHAVGQLNPRAAHYRAHVLWSLHATVKVPCTPAKTWRNINKYFNKYILCNIWCFYTFKNCYLSEFELIRCPLFHLVVLFHFGSFLFWASQWLAFWKLHLCTQIRFPKLGFSTEPPGGLLKHVLLGPTPRISDLVEICISNRFPGGSSQLPSKFFAVGVGTTHSLKITVLIMPPVQLGSWLIFKS